MPTTYKNAICLPCRGCENSALYPNARGGVFDSDHRAISDAFLRREYRQNVRFDGQKWDPTSGTQIKLHRLILPGEIGETQQHLKGEYIFAGYLFPHFGHFLLESLAALWYIREHPDTPIIWLGVHNQDELGPIEKAFIELYKIRNPIHILTEQTEVERLIVPQPGYLIHTRYSKEQIAALKVTDCPSPTPGKKVWLSRSRLTEGAIVNEFQLETILERQGWTIFHPQDHSLRDQVDMVKDAEVVAGVEGSAFHIFVTIPDFKGEIMIFARRSRIEFDFVLIAETLGLNQSVFYPPCIVWAHDQKHWEYNRFWLGLDFVLDKLHIADYAPAPHLPKNNLPKILAALIEHFGFKSIVELGATSDSLSLASPPSCSPVSVSMNVEWNPASLPKHIRHLDISADMLFAGGVLKSAPNAFVFRHYENEQEVIRAFTSSLNFAHKGTIWLIEYNAAERPIADENKLPEETARTSKNATLLKLIASCFPMLSVSRLRGSNAAIIWQKPRPAFAPSLDSFANLANHESFDRSPVISLNDFAKAYKEVLTK